MVKFHTIQTPPACMPEPKSTLKDECRQSDFVPLPALLERFLASGAVAAKYRAAQSLSVEEKEALYDRQDLADLAEDDIAVQKAFADSVLNRVVSKQEKAEKKPEQPEQPVEPEKSETVENA